VRVIDEDGVMIRHLELDPAVDYQRRGSDMVPRVHLSQKI
jgi:hypothetical protein